MYSSIPDPDTALATSRIYATHPHLAGSTEDFSDAKAILRLFQTEFNLSVPANAPIFSAGSSESRTATLGASSTKHANAWIDVYYPVMNTPRDRALQILDADGNVAWDADLVEDGDPRDPEAGEYRDYVPTFHGLSKDGDVEGQLVYANYGRKEDYDELVAQGVDFTGKIVLARYVLSDIRSNLLTRCYSYGSIFRGLKISLAQELGLSFAGPYFKLC